MRHRTYSSIGIKQEHLAQLKSVRKRWEQRAGKKFRWSDFLMMLLAIHEQTEVSGSRGEALIAEMHQNERPMTDEEMAKAGIEPDDAMTLEMAGLTGGRAHLSEETIDTIAERVAEKVMSKLRAHIEKEAQG